MGSEASEQEQEKEKRSTIYDSEGRSDTGRHGRAPMFGSEGEQLPGDQTVAQLSASLNRQSIISDIQYFQQSFQDEIDDNNKTLHEKARSFTRAITIQGGLQQQNLSFPYSRAGHYEDHERARALSKMLSETTTGKQMRAIRETAKSLLKHPSAQRQPSDDDRDRPSKRPRHN